MTRSRFHNFITYMIIPAAIVWMEMALHIRMKTELFFCPIYIAFGISFGLIFSLILSLIGNKAEKTVRMIMLVILWLIFAAESVGYLILQSYYPPTTLGTAAENRLYDYIDIIKTTVMGNALYLALLFVPVVFGAVVPARGIPDRESWKSSDKNIPESRYRRRWKILVSAIILVLVFAFHFAGLLLTGLDWGGGDMTPAKLYRMDENLDLQVERLGLMTMIRLDIYHKLFPDSVMLPDITDIPIEPIPETVVPEPEPEPEPTAEPVDRSPQVMDVDFAALMENPDSKVQWLASYMNSVKPTNKNEYTGMFEGYNVVFLCLEAFSGAGICEELTPTLYKLSNECFVFNNFYTPLYFGSTNAGECQNLLGLYPKQGSPMSLQESGRLGTNCYFSLGEQLSRLGYHNIGFHNGWDMYDRERTMSNLEYHDWYYLGHGLKGETWASGSHKWPQRDTFMIENTMEQYVGDEVPFNVYYMTISGHTPYGWSWIAEQYREQLDAYDWSEETKAYMATVMEVDRAMEALLKGLEEAGQLDRTLIVAVADHIPYTAVEAVGELRGTNYGTSADASSCNERYLDTEVYRNTLIMWTGSMEEKVVVDKVCTQVDILPTISNLLGLEYDSRMLPGSDMLSRGDGLVIFYSKSWRSDNGYYNSFTQEFTLNDGLKLSDEVVENYVDVMNKVVDCKRNMTTMILATDFYELALGE